MDRRQRRTREAIFKAFTTLLSYKDFTQITVGEIIECANIGRATFYSHFETKDFLLKEFCEELFCHIFDTEKSEESKERKHRHIFECSGSNSVFLHLFQHLKENDNNILNLLSSQNNALFLKYFRSNLSVLIDTHTSSSEFTQKENLPVSFWKNHIESTFIETLKWWIDNGMKESPELITRYFYKVLQ